MTDSRLGRLRRVKVTLGEAWQELVTPVDAFRRHKLNCKAEV
jgi:hypothetical protein